MPLVLVDRVRDTTTTTGTGTVTLSGTAPTGYQNFSVIGNGNTTYYTINAGSQWEVGIGTYSSTGPTLARNTVLESSNANALVDFAAGTKDVFVTYPSDRSVYQDGASIAAGTAVLPVANGGTGATTLTTNGVIYGNGTSAVAATAAGTTGQVLVGNTGGAPSWATLSGIGVTSFSAGTTGLTPSTGTTGAVTLAGTLGVANGGTGVTTSTGTGSVVLSNSPTLVTPTLGAASATSIAAALGSVSAPSYTFTGDLNTGIYSPAADTLAFVEGGVEVMRITSAGNVGVGTSSPAAKLDVQGTDGVSSIIVRDSATTNIFDVVPIASNGALVRVFDNAAVSRVQFTAYGASYFNAGNVGIGTTSPAAKLDVVGDGIRAVTTTTTSAGSPLGSQIYLGDANFASSFALRGPGIGAVFDAGQAVAASLAFYTYSSATRNERMRLDPNGNLGIGCTPLSVTRFQTSIGTDRRFSVFLNGSDNVFGFLTDAGNWTDTFLNGSPLRLGANGTERMRILSTGEVGVNTTAPGTTFEVALSTSGSPGLRASRSGAQTQYIQMDIGGGASARLFATGGNKAMFITNNNTGAGLGTATDSTFIQVPGPSANTPITAVYIESSTANVGIGTTAPAGRVHATNTYTNTSNTNFIADGNIPGLNLRPANGRFSLLASYGAANTSSIVLGTGTANPSTEAMRFDHSTGGINVGAATPNAAAQLQVDSTTRGFLPPRMTTAQRDAIATPPNGLVLYNTSTDKLQVRAAGAWVDLH